MTDKKVAMLAGTAALLTYDLEMNFPGTNKPCGWTITLAGPAHEQTKALSDEATRESQRKAADMERAQVNGRKWKGEEDQSPDDIRRRNVTNVCRRIVTWSPVEFENGEVPFSLDAAVDLFLDPSKGAFYLQVVEYLTSERAFLKVSASV